MTDTAQLPPSSSGPTASEELVVRVRDGLLRGGRARGVRYWRGIPYAAAPTKDLRLRAPRPPAPWAGVRDATSFGPISPQSRTGQFVGSDAKTPIDEDCLTLNVIVPDAGAGADTDADADAAVSADARPAAAARPVMVYVHGGAYSVGSSAEYPRQGENLVRHGGVVYVSMNYRLGALGFLDLRAFGTAERPIDANLGLRDIVAALEWVRDNIAAFGGDPGNVTLFGESAGGNAVTTLMTVPSAAGLFARAIAQSAPTNAVYPPEVTAVWADEFVELLSERVDRDELEATTDDDAGRMLVEAPWHDLVEATVALSRYTPDRHPGTISLCPVIDGDFLPVRPLDAFRDGHAHPIPLIIGTNDREGSLFTGRLDILATTTPRIRAIFAKTKKKARKAIKRAYPGLPSKRAAADFGGDYAFWFPSVKVAERHSRYAPVHFYRFDIAPRLVHLVGIDATHGLELFALFDRMNSWFARAMTAAGGRRAFRGAGERMRDAWLSFAATGDPGPQWPVYDEKLRRTLIIDTTDRIEWDPRQERRLAWQEFVPHV